MNKKIRLMETRVATKSTKVDMIRFKQDTTQSEENFLHMVTVLEQKSNAQENSKLQEKSKAKEGVKKERREVNELKSMVIELKNRQQVMANCRMTEEEIIEQNNNQSMPLRTMSKEVKVTDFVRKNDRNK